MLRNPLGTIRPFLIILEDILTELPSPIQESSAMILLLTLLPSDIRIIRMKVNKKEMTLSADEFIRRFMLHILPPRFIKIRHYGFMSNSNRKKLLPKCRSLLNQKAPVPKNPEDGSDMDDTKCRCPKCNGKLILYKYEVVLKPKFIPDSSWILNFIS